MVVYLRGGPPGVRKNTHRETVLGEVMVRFHYFSFGLSGSSAEEHLKRPEPLAWALTSLMKAEKLTRPRHLLEVFRRIHHADLPWKHKHRLADCVEYNLKLDTEERKELADMLARRENEDVQSFKSDWMLRLEQEAEQRGKQVGRQEGRKEGIQRVVLSLLEQRFESVPEPIRHRVQALEDPDELTRLAGRVSTAESLAELGLTG